MNEKWISIDDRFPEEHQRVLVCRCVFGDCRIDIFTYKGNGKWEYNNSEWDTVEDVIGHRISHWMPLPEEPKGV